MKLLHIDSSILGDNSVSRPLTRQLVDRLAQENPGLEVTYWDLAADPVPHITGALLGAGKADPKDLTPELRRDVEIGARALDSFMAADIVVLGAPMYNFTVSTQLKAWLDRIAVAGKTFRYTSSGSEGLAGGKRVIAVSTRGGFYGAGTPIQSSDHQETYLRTIFAFMGINDIEYIRAEGVNTGPENKAKAIEGAKAQIAGFKAKKAA